MDRFGNLITNLPFIWLADAGADWRERWECKVGERSLALVRTYGESKGRAPVALANSYDRMEVALARGSAAAELGLGRGAEVRFVPRRASAASRPAKSEKAAAAVAKPAKSSKQPHKNARHKA